MTREEAVKFAKNWLRSQRRDEYGFIDATRMDAFNRDFVLLVDFVTDFVEHQQNKRGEQ